MNDTTELRLPQLADSVTSVKLSAWLKQEGDRVEAGEPIVEVETDKTNVELDAPATGVVRAIQVAAGTDGLEAGVVLALIAQVADGAGAPAASAVAAEEPPADETTGGRVSTTAPDAEIFDGVAATPLARRMAAAAGLDLSTIRAVGRGDRIGKADVDRVLAEQRGARPVEARSPAPTSPPVETGARGADDVPHHEQRLTAMRRVTATRMQHAKQTVPHFYLRTECAVDAALDLLATAKRLPSDATPTLTDLVVRAAGFALRRVPEANSGWADGVVRVFHTVDIALAVTTPNGLITPIVRGADRKDLSTIARETKTLATRAREGTLAPAEYAGGTFTISSLGMYGVESLYAIVNPPQSCILGVGAAIRRPVVAGNTLQVGAVMACTLSADHRVIDGAVGAELLAALKSYIEQPGLMLV